MSSIVAEARQGRADSRATRCRTHVRKRRIARAEIVALVMIAVALVAATLITRGGSAAPASSECIRVEPGQTLWTLAEQHPVPGLTTEQTAQVIADLNHISHRELAAGTTIRIPARLQDDLAVAWR